MLLSDIGGKEIVNLNNGERLGIIADSDIIIDENTGKILSLLVPERKLHLKLFGNNENIEIPWNAIKKIGQDMIIIEIEEI